jgi:hypothetical protein
MTMIRLSGSQLHAARVLVGLSHENPAERAGLCRDSIRKWETSSDALPAATYSHLCRAVDVLENEGARFSGDGVSALSGDSPDYLIEAVPVASENLRFVRIDGVAHQGSADSRHLQGRGAVASGNQVGRASRSYCRELGPCNLRRRGRGANSWHGWSVTITSLRDAERTNVDIDLGDCGSQWIGNRRRCHQNHGS